MRINLKLLALCFLIAFYNINIAQGQMTNPDNSKKITVMGSAEMEIVPDEIHFTIALKEYKDGSRKVSIDQLEAQLASAVKNAGIDKKDFQVENVYGYNWDWRRNKSKEFLSTKSYRLTVSDVNLANKLIAQVDERGINSAGVSDYSHSKIEEYRKEVKKKALQAAKAKADYLLESIGEKTGGVIEVNEAPALAQSPILPMHSNYAMEAADAGYQANIGFKSIKLKAEIKAVFEIK